MPSAKRSKEDDPLGRISLNAAAILDKRYLLKNDQGRIVENPSQMFRRVARVVASVETRYGAKDVQSIEDAFYEMMTRLEFLPNSPTLMNAGTRLGQLSACFVLPVEDSMEGIFESLKNMAIIHQSGGGTGFSFSRLRPAGDIINSTMCRTSGPLSFISVYDKATDVVKQGGRRRGANMAILRVDHPDIQSFITAKKNPDALQSFNLSVAVTDDFISKAGKGQEYDLINPRTGEATGRLNARNVLDMIVTMAWHSGEPGLIFIDEVNRHNPTPWLGTIESTNPCGEQPLLPYESCNLGSIDLSKFVQGRKIDWKRLDKTVRLAVRFLDDVIDANHFPIPQIEEVTKANRKIGLGVMGFADMLIKLRIPYDSIRAVRSAEQVMRFVNRAARDQSVQLGEERGSFPNLSKSIFAKRYKHLRNASVTTVAPTGTISIIAGCSSGIEPLFGISFARRLPGDEQSLETNSDFEDVSRKKGFYSKELMHEIAQRGSVKGMDAVPPDVQKVFVTALDIDPEWHVRIQAAFQKHTDSAVSKTINFPNSATIRSLEKAFLLAHKLKCKGITAYRYGSREGQILMFADKSTKNKYVRADPEYAGGCVVRECSF